MLALILCAVLLGVILLFATGPATIPIGGQAGFGRALLTLQLILKPVKGLLTVFGLPLLLVGVTASVGTLLVLSRNTSSPQDLRAGT
jgi:hypothetical protein